MPGPAWRGIGSQSQAGLIAGFEGNKSGTWGYLGTGTRESGERHMFPSVHSFFHLCPLSSCFGLPGVPWPRKDLSSPGS